MFSPRWRKVWGDLSTNRTRTALVIASIAVGIFAVGTVQQLRSVILNEMQNVYDQSSAAHATIIAGNMDDALVDSIRRMPEIAAADGRASISVNVQIAPEASEAMNITAVDDFENIRINLLQQIFELDRHPDFGAAATRWPKKGEIVIERGSLDARDALPDGVAVGDLLQLENEAGQKRSVTIVGAVYDANSFPAGFTGTATGYVDFQTFERLGGTRTYSQINILVNGTPEQLLDKDYISSVAANVGKKIEKSGRTVGFIRVPEPGELIFQDIFETLSLLLTPLGGLALFLSGFLVINTISALMSQQVRQIGIMKSIGARRGQLVRMYLGAILIYSLLALAVAIPLTVVVGGLLTGLLGGFINIDFPTLTLPLNVLIIQVIVGLLVPLLAALYPVFRGTGITVREALSDLGAGKVGTDMVTFLLSKIRGLGRPLQLSLRNTFRRRARLISTLIMLVLGGMIFMTIGSVRISLSNLIEEALAYNQFDIQVEFERTYRTAQINAIVNDIPGVTLAESWGSGSFTTKRADGSDSSSIRVTALPAESEMVQPTLTDGRWLLPTDENALVVSQRIFSQVPDLEVGDTLLLEDGDREAPWTVVGIAQVLGGPPNLIPVYANYPYYASYSRSVGKADSVQMKIEPSLDAAVTATRIEEALTASGLRVASTFTADRIRQISGGFFDIIVYLLSGMGVLIATVGSLGLMGTMSTNVLERTREIGVMRSIGASNGAVQWIVIVEGVLIGLISWIIGAALAYPIGAAISSGVGQVLFNTPLPYTFSSTGVFVWFAIVSILAAAASFFPAWNASRLTVREVLSYE